MPGITKVIYIRWEKIKMNQLQKNVEQKYYLNYLLQFKMSFFLKLQKKYEFSNFFGIF